MGTNSKIEWTDHTFNPWLGCTKISPGCDHCYAEGWSKRSGLVKWGNNDRRRTSEAYWKAPLKWNAHSDAFYKTHRRRQRVFCASLADVFDNQAPSEWRSNLFELIKQCDRLDWLLLTKRPQNIRKMLPADWGSGYQNVWLGVTTEDQKHYDQRWRILSRIPCVVAFVSYEPAIGPLRLHTEGRQPDWLISGGESGGKARVMDPRWARDVIRDCKQLNVAPFHKQWGTYASNPLVFEKGFTRRQAEKLDDDGKGGGLLNGKTIRKFPRPRARISAA